MSGLGFDRDYLYERRVREQQPAQTHFRGEDAIRRLNDAIRPVQEMPNQNPKTYCMDFDGVLHYHNTGDGAGALGEALEPGIHLAKRIKAAGHKLVILTARPPDQHDTIAGWLKGHGVRADEVTNKKPPAEQYIDDRAAHWPRNFGHGQQTKEVIKKTGKGYQVKSEKGKNLSSPGLSKKAAKKRLAQVEYFKHKEAGVKGMKWGQHRVHRGPSPDVPLKDKVSSFKARPHRKHDADIHTWHSFDPSGTRILTYTEKDGGDKAWVTSGQQTSKGWQEHDKQVGSPAEMLSHLEKNYGVSPEKKSKESRILKFGEGGPGSGPHGKSSSGGLSKEERNIRPKTVKKINKFLHKAGIPKDVEQVKHATEEKICQNL